jgi:pimeloyl-ACP methyl ester carboxylesterase
VPEIEKRIVEGVTLSIRTWPCAEPTAPSMVLLHGTGATAEDWDEVAAQFCDDRTVLAVDLRGHGASSWPGRYSVRLMARDVSGLLELLGIPQVDLVGHSLGGLVACLVAAAPAAPVRRLVLEDVGMPHPRPTATPPRPAGELSFDWAVVEQVRPEIDDPDPHWRQIMADIRAPTLIVAGGEDGFVPQQHLHELADTLSQASLVTIAAGHLIHATRPDEFVAEIRTFLYE